MRKAETEPKQRGQLGHLTKEGTSDLRPEQSGNPGVGECGANTGVPGEGTAHTRAGADQHSENSPVAKSEGRGRRRPGGGQRAKGATTLARDWDLTWGPWGVNDGTPKVWICSDDSGSHWEALWEQGQKDQAREAEARALEDGVSLENRREVISTSEGWERRSVLA